MQAQDVERYLAALDRALTDLGLQTSIPVLLLGGAYMMVQINTRRLTNDIDVFPFVGDEVDHATGMSLAMALCLAADVVAQKYGLPADWLNTIRVGSLQPADKEPQKKLWKKYLMLEVYLPEPEYVLLQKLFIHRPKDQPDIAALFQKLGITELSQVQALVDRYIPQEVQECQHLSDFLVSYFP